MSILKSFFSIQKTVGPVEVVIRTH